MTPLAATGGARLRGRWWPPATRLPDGGLLDGGLLDHDVDTVVVLDAHGRIEWAGPAAAAPAGDARPSAGGPASRLGPGLADAHVHLAFGSAADVVAGSVVDARDLGAPLDLVPQWAARPSGLSVTFAGEILTAPGGYPSRSWGADGFARFAATPREAMSGVDAVVEAGASVVKLAFEPRGGPVLAADVAAAAVERAHHHGVGVVAHALTAAMVERALQVGVDELAHTPTERLPDHLVCRLAASGVTVVSTLATFVASGEAAGALANARALVAAGIPLRYGTDLGNTATTPGADPRELELLAAAGLGVEGALAAAVAPLTGDAGDLRLAVLDADPRTTPDTWRRPVAVVAGGRWHSRL